jgi:hypothetical protein
MVIESDPDKEEIIAQKPSMKEFLRSHDPNNCLGLAFTNFVCFTYEKSAHEVVAFAAHRDK